jgi:hypothetical protein
MFHRKPQLGLMGVFALDVNLMAYVHTVHARFLEALEGLDRLPLPASVSSARRTGIACHFLHRSAQLSGEGRKTIRHASPRNWTYSNGFGTMETGEQE